MVWLGSQHHLGPRETPFPKLPALSQSMWGSDSGCQGSGNAELAGKKEYPLDSVALGSGKRPGSHGEVVRDAKLESGWPRGGQELVASRDPRGNLFT